MPRETFTLSLFSGPDGSVESYDLRYDWRALEWFENKSHIDLIPALTEKFGVRTATWLILAGIVHNNPKLNYERVRDMIGRHLDNGGNLPELSETMVECMRAFGVLKPEEMRDMGEARRGPAGILPA